MYLHTKLLLPNYTYQCHIEHIQKKHSPILLYPHHWVRTIGFHVDDITVYSNTFAIKSKRTICNIIRLFNDSAIFFYSFFSYNDFRYKIVYLPLTILTSRFLKYLISSTCTSWGIYLLNAFVVVVSSAE